MRPRFRRALRGMSGEPGALTETTRAPTPSKARARVSGQAEDDAELAVGDLRAGGFRAGKVSRDLEFLLDALSGAVDGDEPITSSRHGRELGTSEGGCAEPGVVPVGRLDPIGVGNLPGERRIVLEDPDLRDVVEPVLVLDRGEDRKALVVRPAFGRPRSRAAIRATEISGSLFPQPSAGRRLRGRGKNGAPSACARFIPSLARSLAAPAPREP